MPMFRLRWVSLKKKITSIVAYLRIYCKAVLERIAEDGFNYPLKFEFNLNCA